VDDGTSTPTRTATRTTTGTPPTATRTPTGTTPTDTPTRTTTPTRTPTPRPPMSGRVIISENFNVAATSFFRARDTTTGRTYFEGGKLMLQRYSTGTGFVHNEKYTQATFANVGLRVDGFSATGELEFSCRDDGRYRVQIVIEPSTQTFRTFLYNYSTGQFTLYSRSTSPAINKSGPSTIEIACRGSTVELVVNSLLLTSESFPGTGPGDIWFGVSGPQNEGALGSFDNLTIFEL
jgi:hypothetical protein